MLLTAIITQAVAGGYVAVHPETGTTTQGETYMEAASNFKEVTRLYLEEFSITVRSHSIVTTFEVEDALIYKTYQRQACSMHFKNMDRK